jgi:hypothetical protein
MKQIKGGGSLVDCFNQCNPGSSCSGGGHCVQVSCNLGGLPYNVCI